MKTQFFARLVFAVLTTITANAITNTPQMPRCCNSIQIQAVYFARMCPMVFKRKFSLREKPLAIHTAATFRDRSLLNLLFTDGLLGLLP